MTTPHFLNVDLDIESKSPLRPIARELGKRVVVMHSGRIRGRHCLFLESAKDHKTPDATIHDLCDLIEGLSPAARRLWDGALRRGFDIGYESRFKIRHCNQYTLRPDTIQRIAGLKAGVTVTFYRQDDTPPHKRVLGKSKR